MIWQPTLGAWPEGPGTYFRVWAPLAGTVQVVPEKSGLQPFTLEKHADGTFAGLLPHVHAGDRYRYRIDDRGPFPDPASRFQPEGVHGPSEVVAPREFAWSTADWQGIGLEDLVVYELHVGTFSAQGTFAGATDHLEQLAELGVTAVELMPLA